MKATSIELKYVVEGTDTGYLHVQYLTINVLSLNMYPACIKNQHHLNEDLSQIPQKFNII